jgi:L-seryl-tRNA(Ser) seleniumtransferase
MLTMTADAIGARASVLASAIQHLPGWKAEVVAGVSAVGGGSAPGLELPTSLIRLERQGVSAAALDGQLRAAVPAVIARIDQDRVVLDLRTVDPSQDQQIERLLASLPVQR